eukprot:5224895-Prorocentrum_lima.AAC.1
MLQATAGNTACVASAFAGDGGAVDAVCKACGANGCNAAGAARDKRGMACLACGCNLAGACAACNTT